MSYNLAESLHLKGWRDHCRQETDHRFGSGIAYLCQLMAHDATMTVKLERGFVPASYRSAYSGHVNIAPLPLMLNTIYGRSVAADRALFQPHAPEKFNLWTPNHRGLDLAFPRFTRDLFEMSSRPLLADERNAASPILIQLVARFMQFHNKQVDIAGKEGFKGDLAFSYARAVTTRTWHNLIRKEMLPTVIKDATDSRKPEFVLQLLNERDRPVEFTQAAFRSFHSLVLERYQFNEFLGSSPISIKKVLSNKGLGPSTVREVEQPNENDTLSNQSLRNWLDQWATDWSLFFGESAKNKTRFTPSFGFSPKGGKAIASRDFEASSRMSVARPNTLGVEADPVRKMLGELGDVAHGHVNYLGSMTQVPLIVALLAEDFYDPKFDGRLGWSGSALVRPQVEAMLESAEKTLEASVPENVLEKMPDSSRLPTCFLSLIEHHKGENHG